MSGKSQNFIKLLPSAYSSSRNKNFVSTSRKSCEKQKLIFSHSVLFHNKARLCLKYFVNDCKHRFHYNQRCQESSMDAKNFWYQLLIYLKIVNIKDCLSKRHVINWVP